MKSLSVKLGVILAVIGLAIFGYTEVWGEDWKLYSDTEMELWFFDASSITQPSKNIVRVWVKMDLTEKGVLDAVEKLGKKYENLKHSIILWEINCAEKKQRRLSATNYDHKGSEINSISFHSQWRFINPESMIESLYKEVCK
jgi:hypothetical protein